MPTPRKRQAKSGPKSISAGKPWPSPAPGTSHVHPTNNEHDNPSKDRLAMVADAAYFRAEKRNFCPGHELDDWLAAEREVDTALEGLHTSAP